MRAPSIRAVGLLLAGTLAARTQRVMAQPLAQRVAAMRSGTVEMRYAPRPGVCGDGRSYYSIGRSMRIGDGFSYRNDTDHSTCIPGPARARLRLTGGEITDVRVYVGPTGRAEAPDTDLGMVSSREAADFFLRIAETGSGRATHGAISAAVLADSASVWRRLLAIARDSATRTRSTRQEALFWVGRFAAAKSSGDGEDLSAASDDGDRDDPRNAAIFALSQLRNREGVPALLHVAQTHPDPALRRQALFWLGESGDPRGASLFEDILRR
jgi:HEAT repeats